MEERKLKEIEYYDQEAQVLEKESGSQIEFDPFLLESYQYLKSFFNSESNKEKIVLDYGCGTGMHLSWLSKKFKQVIGVDLSENSLKAAQKRIEKERSSNVSLVLDDCERLHFADNYFDVVFDGGTFSSLDFDIALKEIYRILKPGGVLIGIETLGHNPLTNLKRKINVVLNKRTAWAESHIFKLEYLKKMEKNFKVEELKFFHIVSWMAFPFLNLRGSKMFLGILEKIDHILIFPFLKKYSFKVIFVAKK